MRVLLVDEEEDGRADLARRLSRSGGIDLVGVASDLGETADLLKRRMPDLVLLDLHLRDGNEFESCRALCELSHAPVVALTSFMTPERWRDVQRAGVQAYLLKHVDTGKLGRELEQIGASLRAERMAKEEQR